MSQSCLSLSFRALLWVGVLVPATALMHCNKLRDSGPKALVFPEDGATGVPVNAVIEVQYPKELGIKDEQMKYGLFSIRECESDSFAYLKPQTENPLAPTTTSSNEPEAAAPTKNADGTTTPAKQQNSTAAKNTQTKYKSTVNFFHSHIADSTGTVFNYLVTKPEQDPTPLKPGTTYCVGVKKLQNEKKETIDEQETKFTTEDSPSLEFETKIDDVEFFGTRLTGSAKDANGKTLRDFVLLNVRQAVDPTQLKSQVKLCLESSEKTTTTEACKDFGKEVPSDIYLIESLQTNTDKTMVSKYNLYAVAPRQGLKVGDKFKVVVNLDITKNQETSVGNDPSAPIEVDEESSLHWVSLFKDDIKDSNGNSVFSDKAKFFYIGSGS